MLFGADVAADARPLLQLVLFSIESQEISTCAGVVVTLARKYRVSLPVLTAVAQVLNGHLNAEEAVYEIMNLPQIEER